MKAFIQISFRIFSTNQIHSRRNHFNLRSTYLLQVASTVISLNFMKNKIQMYQYLFYDYYLVYILATVWDTSTSISNFTVFQHTVLNLLKQSRLDFSNPKQTFVRIQLLEIDCGRSLFSDIICDNAINSHTAVDWKQQRCKCTMVYLKNSFIVSSFLFLIIHNIALLQGSWDNDRR